jgi:hypothetical protein
MKLFLFLAVGLLAFLPGLGVRVPLDGPASSAGFLRLESER